MLSHWQLSGKYSLISILLFSYYWTCIKSFVNWAIHLFPRQNKVFTLYMANLLVVNFCLYLIPPFYFLKWNRSFGTCKLKSAKLFVSFSKAPVSFLWNLASIFMAIKHNSSIVFLAHELYTLAESSPIKCKCSDFWVLESRFEKSLMSILKQQVNSTSGFKSFLSVITHNSSLNL